MGPLDPFLGVLDDDELAHAEALHVETRKREYIVNRAGLRYVLSRYSAVAPRNWRFERNQFGKPVLASPSVSGGNMGALQFNLSHAGQLTICAICRDARIGVDIEAHANDAALLGVADQYFSDREINDLNVLPTDQQGRAFFDYWTLKEAYVKARGEGLSQPLDSFSFFPVSDTEIGFESHSVSREPDGAAAWYFRLLRPQEGYTAALAVQMDAPKLRYFGSAADGPLAAAQPQAVMLPLQY